MKKYAFTSNVVYEQNTNVDEQNGIIRNVVLANKGLNKNGSYFSDRFLNELLEAGQNAKFGIKARFGHPNMCSTSLGSFVGNYKNFKIENGNLYGDLHLADISKKTQVEGRGISMYDYILSMAKEHDLFFGNSIHISAYDVEEAYQDEQGNEQTAIGHKLERWIGSDLVDDPAATDSLFSGVEDLGTITTHFLDTNPEIFEVIEKNPKILIDFFERYENYYNRKNLKSNNMSFLSKMKKVFSSKTYDIDLTLANGDVITVITEENDPKEGDEVKDSDGNALPDGDYLLADGRTLVVVEGMIAEIKEDDTSDGQSNGENPSDVQQSINELKKSISKIGKDNSLFAKAVLELNDKFETLAKGVQSNYKAFDEKMKTLNPQNPEPKTSIEELRERRKEYGK